VFHPLLSEAVIRFQATAISEIFPAMGPVKTLIMGKADTEKVRRARRVKDEMNYQLTTVMTEYRFETELLLFNLALAGSAFKKVYFDPALGRQTAVYVSAEDFVVAYGTADLGTCPRFTHVMRKTKNDIRKMQVSGFYRDIDLPEPVMETTPIEQKINKLKGETKPATFDNDDRHALLEMHVDIDLPGYESPDEIAQPYVITVDKGSHKILSIYRNWKAGDALARRRQHFVAYQYLPGLGFYGCGLIHIMGGLAKSATSIMRQLVDAGTLSNLPGGLKSRGLRIKGDSTPIMPGEFRDVDIASGSVRDNIAFLPYKEPSAVLYQLLGNVVDEGRRIGSTADMPVKSLDSEMPVGTTLALIEQSSKVMTAVQARLHASLRQELALLVDIIRDILPDKYDYDVGDPTASRVKDFGPPVSVIPVSDPNAASLSQRIFQHQAAMQLAGQAPQIYDLPKLHERTLTVLGIKDADEIVKDPEKTKSMDPVGENMAILSNKPVKAYLWQDHESHIAVHMAAAQDPKIMALVGQSPQASLIQGALAAHVQEHIGMAYRARIEKELGVALPNPNEELPPDMEVQLSRLTAEAARRVLGKNQQEAQAQKIAQTQQDPVIQIQQQEAQAKVMDAQSKAEERKGRLVLDAMKAQADKENKEKQMAMEAQVIQAEMKVDAVKALDDSIARQEKDRKASELEAAKLGVETARVMTQKAGDEARTAAQLKGQMIQAATSVATTAMQTRAQERSAERAAKASAQKANKPSKKPKPEAPSE